MEHGEKRKVVSCFNGLHARLKNDPRKHTKRSRLVRAASCDFVDRFLLSGKPKTELGTTSFIICHLSSNQELIPRSMLMRHQPHTARRGHTIRRAIPPDDKLAKTFLLNERPRQSA